MQDAGCRVHAGCRVQGAGCRVQGSPSTRCRTAIQAADSAVAGTTPGVWKVVSAKANDGKSPFMIAAIHGFGLNELSTCKTVKARFWPFVPEKFTSKSGKFSTFSLNTTLTSLLSTTTGDSVDAQRSRLPIVPSLEQLLGFTKIKLLVKWEFPCTNPGRDLQT